ncbi:MAG: hypothetical protein AABY22_09240 [Nanoarchaeota archaeon]
MNKKIKLRVSNKNEKEIYCNHIWKDIEYMGSRIESQRCTKCNFFRKVTQSYDCNGDH